MDSSGGSSLLSGSVLVLKNSIICLDSLNWSSTTCTVLTYNLLLRTSIIKVQ